MKKYIFALVCAAIMLVCGCGKEKSENKIVIDPVEKVTWATVVKAYPFLDGFPVLDKKNYIFSGSYGGGSFGLSFSVDTE